MRTEKEDLATQEWLQSQEKGTRNTYKNFWAHFLEFTGLTGDQILADRKNDKDFHWEKKVLALKTFAIEKGFYNKRTKKIQKFAENTATGLTTAARSFFEYHRVPLKFRKQEKKHLSDARTKYEDYRFSTEDLRKLYDIGDLTERYVVTAGKSFGLRAGDFINLRRGDLEPFIEHEVPISIGVISTEKESIKAYPFIDTDAQPVIKLMLEKMTREGRTKPSDRMLLYKDEIQLTRIIQRCVIKAGLNVGNKTVRFHCMRKYLSDKLSSYMSESKWKQIVGKKISESAYVSPDSLRADYLRAMAETTFTKAIGSEDIEKIAKKQALLALAKSMGLDETQVTSLFKRFSRVKPLHEAKRIDDEIAELERWIQEKRTQGENCSDGVHCGEENFKQIQESELLGALKEGWEIVKELSNGQIIVKRNT